MMGRSAGIMSFVSMLLLVCGEARAEWRDWWWTQEQRAQQALDAGQAAKAAQLFSDPARRAYAEIEAGQYGSAAKRLAPLKDPDAQYNRGNALARAGDLRGALAAYDAALARAAKGSVTERDARRNRDLVERQLQKQQQQQQQQQQQPSGDQQKNEESAQSGERSSPASEQKSGQQSRDAPGREQSRPPVSPDQKRSSATNPSNDRDRQSEQDDSPSTQEQGANAEEEDARAAGADDRAREAAGERQSARAANQDSPPTSERALAVEQWLRQIPDDPGGLLRRKFLLEHRRKQSEAQP